VNQLLYSQIIGSLMYLSSATRPDISYAVCRLARYLANPGDRHWVALYRVLRYLKGAMNLGMKYTGFMSVLEGFSDANWISDSDQMKSTSGYVFTLAGGAVSWRSSKQTVSTRSTKEAELVALDSAALEAEWLRDLLSDLPMLAKPIPVVLVYCDNTSVLLKVNSRKDNQKSSRHIRRRLDSCRHARETGVIIVDYIKSERNLADPFTKELSLKPIQAVCMGMGLVPC
jgi:hypothetical protein